MFDLLVLRLVFLSIDDEIVIVLAGHDSWGVRKRLSKYAPIKSMNIAMYVEGRSKFFHWPPFEGRVLKFRALMLRMSAIWRISLRYTHPTWHSSWLPSS